MNKVMTFGKLIVYQIYYDYTIVYLCKYINELLVIKIQQSSRFPSKNSIPRNRKHATGSNTSVFSTSKGI